MHTLEMGYCTGITDAAFVHLRGLHTLDMRGCTGITDAGIAHLRGILNMGASTGTACAVGPWCNGAGRNS